MTSDSTSLQPRITVVIPCYNDGATLGEAVASARAQEPCEIVVVDDGSSDPATLEFLRELDADGDAARVITQENHGLSAARMTGLAASNGRYVFPLDADDILQPHCLTALADVLDAEPGRAAAWGNETAFGDVDAHNPGARFGLDPWRITYFNALPYAVMVRREVLEEVGGWQLRGGYEDWDLWMALAERGYSGVHVERDVLLYRIHGVRMWREAVSRHDEIFTVLRERHPRLFERRRENWRNSPEPLRLRLTLPVIARLPGVSFRGQRWLHKIVTNPFSAACAIVKGLRRALS